MNAYVAEIVGTAILILLGNGVVANVVLNKSKGSGSGWIVITFGWGMGVAFAVYAVGHISGAHINPAVTIGLASIGSFEWGLVPGYIICQMVGAFIGSVLVWLVYNRQFASTEDQGGKLACHSTAPEVRSSGWNLVTEIVGTAVLVFGVLSIVSLSKQVDLMMGESALVTSNQDLIRAFAGAYLAPMLVGLLVFSIGLSLGGPTGYAINPARDLGPRIAHAVLPIPNKGDSNWGYSWIPVVGPIIGGIIGAQLYTLLGL